MRWKTHFHLLPEGVTRRLLVWCRCRPGDHQMEAREKERLRKRGWGEEGERKRKIEIDFQGSNWEQKRLPRDSSSGFAFYGGKNKQNKRSNRFTNLKERRDKKEKQKEKKNLSSPLYFCNRRHWKHRAPFDASGTRQLGYVLLFTATLYLNRRQTVHNRVTFCAISSAAPKNLFCSFIFLGLVGFLTLKIGLYFSFGRQLMDASFYRSILFLKSMESFNFSGFFTAL